MGVEYIAMKITEFIVRGQPDFPLVDISATDGRAVQDALSDPTALKTLHHAAEYIRPHYRVSHVMVATTVETEFNSDWARAASIGLIAYEAMNFMVNSVVSEIDPVLCGVFCEQMFRSQITMKGLQNCLSAFRSEMSSTAEVVQYIATLYIDFEPDIILLGAAISRALDLQLIEHTAALQSK